MNHLEKLNDEAMDILSIMQNLDKAVAVTNDRGLIVSVNFPFCDMFGYEEEKVIGMSISELVADEEHRRNHHTYIQNYIMTGKSNFVNNGGLGVRHHVLVKDNMILTCSL